MDASLWDEYAERYKDSWSLNGAGSDLLSATPGYTAGCSVLDVCAGSNGRLTHLALQQGCSVTAVDYSARSLEVLKKSAPSITCVVGDCREMSQVEDGAYDVAVSSFGIFLAGSQEDFVKSLACMAKKTRPGGGVATSMPGDLKGNQHFSMISKVMGAYSEGRPKPPAWVVWANEEALGNLMEKAGLQDVHCKMVTVTNEFASAEEVWKGLRYGAPMLAAKWGALTEEQVEKVHQGILADLGGGDGPVSVQLKVLIGAGKVPE